MKIYRAPLRISYVGGGTDYPDFYNYHDNAGVLAASIQKYVYVFSHPLSDVAEENIRFTYRDTESVLEIDEIQHPVLREMLRNLNYRERSNFGTLSDLPSGVGLGGSSSFTVALAALLHDQLGISHDKKLNAEKAIHIERNILAEPGGVQDQFTASYGGLRAYRFKKNEVLVCNKIENPETLDYLENRQMLVWLGKSRDSASYASFTNDSIKSKLDYLKKMAQLFETTSRTIEEDSNPSVIFEALRDAVKRGWAIKKEFSQHNKELVSKVEKIVQDFSDASLKLCGAGGSGFALIMAEPKSINEIRSQLSAHKIVEAKIDSAGCSQVTVI